MMNAKAFPKDANHEEALDLYFQLCSLQLKPKSMAIVAATLANEGVCPITGVRVFHEETVNHVLSVMYSCGMYDYSGEWGYSVGIPAKSGISGCIYLVIPKVMGICIYSSRIDQKGNSVRGVEVSKLLLREFTMHRYDFLKGVVTPFSNKHNLTKSCSERQQFFADLLDSVNNDDLAQLQRLIESIKDDHFDINLIKDYDDVTLAHLCCSAGHVQILLYLINLGADFWNIQDKWELTPYERAIAAKNENIIEALNKVLCSESPYV